MPAISLAFAPDHQGIEAMVATKEMSPERSTIEIESPSTPTKYSTLKALIQVKLLGELHAAVARRRRASTATPAATSDRKLATRAITREALSTKPFGRPSEVPHHHQHDDGDRRR